jgi:hypothetical protein
MKISWKPDRDGREITTDLPNSRTESAQSGKMLLVIRTSFAINAREKRRFLVLTSKPFLLSERQPDSKQTTQIGGTDEV